MSDHSVPGASRPGVIHDLGYRHYDGVREGTGDDRPHPVRDRAAPRVRPGPVRQVEGDAVPAAGDVGAAGADRRGRRRADRPQDSLPVSYADYTNQTQLLVSLFAAAQAPVLFSRDLRHRSIVLYLARPLAAPVFALMRWLSLTVALVLFMAVPTLLLFLGAMLSGLDKSDQVTQLLKALVLQTLLALLVAGISRADLLAVAAARLRRRRVGDGPHRADRGGHRDPGHRRRGGRGVGRRPPPGSSRRGPSTPASPTPGTQVSRPSCRSTPRGCWRTSWSPC